MELNLGYMYLKDYFEIHISIDIFYIKETQAIEDFLKLKLINCTFGVKIYLCQNKN